MSTLYALILADGTIVNIGPIVNTFPVGAGQTLVKLSDTSVPANALINYLVQNGALVERTTPLSWQQWRTLISPPSLAQAQAMAISQLIANFEIFIKTLPNGASRYSQLLINSVLASAVNTGNTTAPFPAFHAWQTALLTYYLAQEAAINAATTVEEVQAVDVSIETMETKYGVSGTVMPDPNITAASLA